LIPYFAQSAWKEPVQMSDGFQKPSAMTVVLTFLAVTGTTPSFFVGTLILPLFSVEFASVGFLPLASATAQVAAVCASGLIGF